MIPPTQQALHNFQVDSKIKDIMINEKVINNPNLLGVGLAQYLRVSRRCPTWIQNSIFLLNIKIDPIPFLGLDLIDPRSSFDLTLEQWGLY